MSAVNWTAVAGAFIAGTGVGALAVRVLIEKDLRENAPKEIVFVQNHFNTEAPAATEEELTEPIPEVTDHLTKVLNTPIAEIKDAMSGQTVMVLPEGSVQPEDLENDNPYHRAVTATETPVEVFVGGDINQYGISYIEEEDYLDEDGRFKGKIDIMMDDMNPIFLMDGQPIDDWETRIGQSILLDMYQLVPPGADDILYVRNHRSDEDYEVVRVLQ